MEQTITAFALTTLLIISPIPVNEQAVLVEKSLNLTNRQPDPWVNEVFSDNIVLALRYMDDGGYQRPKKQEEFKKVREPFETYFTLKPGETFAFQEDVLPELEGKVVKTTNGKFNYEQGFRNSGYLMGDGVCHLASFINQSAREAGLEVVAPVNHDFMAIPDIPREFGTSIYYKPGNPSANARQNLYVTNSSNNDITFTFRVSNDKIIYTISR